MKSTLMIMTQCLERLKELHERNIIHRDMKPENLVIGFKGKEKNIYLIDFGLSKSTIDDKKNNNNIAIKKEKIVVGTVRYISMNAHLGNEQYKKDDLESLAYIMIYFIKGELPWQNLKAKSRKEKYSKIYQMKKSSIPNELCNFLPEEIKILVNYIINLNPKQKPDYSKLNNLINNLMNKYSYSNDLQFDWYSSSFLKMLYNSPVVDDGERIESTSIYEEESTNSDIHRKRLKINMGFSNSTKKNNNNRNNFSLNKGENQKITSVKNITRINKLSSFKPDFIKNRINAANKKLEYEKIKEENKNVGASVNYSYLSNQKNKKIARLPSY